MALAYLATFIYHKIQPNAGKYIVHGWYGIVNFALIQNLKSKPFLRCCRPRIASQKLVTIVALPSPSAAAKFETKNSWKIRMARKGSKLRDGCWGNWRYDTWKLYFLREVQRSSYWLEVSWGLVGRKLVLLLKLVVAWPCQMLTMRASSPCCPEMIFIAEVVVILFVLCVVF